MAVHWSLPSAEDLSRYEKLVPGSAQRIIDEYEAERVHQAAMGARRVELDALVRQYEKITQKIEIVLGWLLAGAFVACAGFAVYRDHAIAGAVIAGAMVTGLAVVSVSDRRRKTRAASLDRRA